MADGSRRGKGHQGSGEDKGKKKLKKCFIANRDAYDRVNYLYQAAHLSLAQDPENLELSRYYMSTAKRITDKLVLKIDSQMKQTMCRCCHNLLIPGITSRHRIRGKREKHLVTTCITCGTIKRQRTNNDYEKDTVNAVDLKGDKADGGKHGIE